VGDSFTGDTPLFIKYNNNGWIDIKPIEEIIDETKIQIDALGREYDYSQKPYMVLCRSGWCDCKYVYRHKTDKDIYRVSDNNGLLVDVTEDHSLYNKEKKEIKPSRIDITTELEYYDGVFEDGKEEVSYDDIFNITLDVVLGIRDRFPTIFMNLKPELQGCIVENWESMYSPSKEYSKIIQAQIMYFKSRL
jgi:intein/homing endonuclease